jgi:hypothetical protein
MLWEIRMKLREIQLKEVPFYILKPGEKFLFNNDEYLKIETVDRCREYAVNLTTFKLTYFASSEKGVFAPED